MILENACQYKDYLPGVFDDLGFNHPKQKSQSSLAVGMNATNSWYHIPIHSYLAQEVRKVTPLEI
ncbi:hypothetical protein [Helicobacter pylori]|uniref:hypothetical protein n=1 Tax=Helicobacter pylori TaxID=210 RepID=UPI0015E6494E|nr:hypothetical protein [Helicobacter pylori]